MNSLHVQAFSTDKQLNIMEKEYISLKKQQNKLKYKVNDEMYLGEFEL